MFFELARILEAKRPRYFIFENVPGLLSAQEGYCFEKIIDTLCELGYSVCWRVLDSKNFGVRQSRRRVFIVGHLGERSPLEILAFGTQYKKDLRMLINGGSQGSRVYLTSGNAVTQCSASGGGGGKTGLYLIDQNPNPQITYNARCITARQDSGVSNHRGEHSAVLANEKKGVTVKIDAELHAEVKRYIEEHGMTMGDFVALALQDELHPKINIREDKNMGNMRTMAFQVPEELFQKIKDYLQRNNYDAKAVRDRAD